VDDVDPDVELVDDVELVEDVLPFPDVDVEEVVALCTANPLAKYVWVPSTSRSNEEARLVRGIIDLIVRRRIAPFSFTYTLSNGAR